MNVRNIVGLAMLFSLFLSGCMRPGFEVKVDAFADVGVSSLDTYFLLPGNASTSDSDLQFREFSGYLHRVLAGKGYRRVGDIGQAKMVIYLAYGIGEPQHHESITSFPVMGPSGISSYVDANTGAVTYVPTFGITGYDITTFTSTTYTSYMLVEAYDLKHFQVTKKKKQLWKLMARSTGDSGDLRRVFPAMVGVSQDYIATDLGRQVTIEINEDDPRLRRLRSMPTEVQVEKK